MKKYLFAAACTLLASAASADPAKYNLDFSCPEVNVISNFGEYVAGYGTEVISGTSRPVYFKTIAWPNGVASDVESSYVSSATNYDGTLGQVTCSYTSSDANNAPFDLIYQITNGKGGLITSKDARFISLQMPVGLNK